MCFCINNAFGYVSENIANGCVGTMNANAIFQVNTYECENGFYLPANAESCEACPNLYTCPGGSFTFNEENSQGLMADGLISNDVENGCGLYGTRLTARFTANTYTCSAGYYLPANGIACAKCLDDNYCLGGTYTFNETDNQGLIPCPAAHPYAPIGMWNELQCGRKLHVGNDVMYLHQSPANPTLHRLFVSFDNKVYSANMVEKQVGKDDPKMSVGVDHVMQVRFSGVEYLVHDDSIE